MKRLPILFLRAVLVAVGFCVLALMLWEPQVEGRNVAATQAEIYFGDPFLAYAYGASIAFFAALLHAWRVLGFMGRGEAFSPRSVKALRNIRNCALVLIAFIAGAELYFFLVVRGTDDIAGGVMMGLLMTIVAAIAASVAAVFEETFRSASAQT